MIDDRVGGREEKSFIVLYQSTILDYLIVKFKLTINNRAVACKIDLINKLICPFINYVS